MIEERKVKEESLNKENTSHEIKLKKLPKKAENKCYVYQCTLYLNRKKIDNAHVTWYIIDKTHPEIYVALTEAGTLTVDIEGLRNVHGSVTIVAKYNDKQYYHILKRWRDKNRRKALALGLGLGIGIPVLAGAIVGIVFGVRSCSPEQYFDTIKYNGEEVYPDMGKETLYVDEDKTYNASEFTAIKNNEEVQIVKISAKSEDSSIVEVITNSDSSFTLNPKTEGSVKI